MRCCFDCFDCFHFIGIERENIKQENKIFYHTRCSLPLRLCLVGVEVIDVRIRRTDLPPENERSIFGRMRAERERQAKLYRSEGQEESAKIKSKADMDKTIILAEAQKTAETLRGQGEAANPVLGSASDGRNIGFLPERLPTPPPEPAAK